MLQCKVSLSGNCHVVLASSLPAVHSSCKCLDSLRRTQRARLLQASRALQGMRALGAGKRTPLDMVSVDCEMCVTAAGYELTRASLVDSSGQVSTAHHVLPSSVGSIADPGLNVKTNGGVQQPLAFLTRRHMSNC